MKFVHLTGNVYIEGEYVPRDVESNWAYPVGFPTALISENGYRLSSGNWDSCGGINTPDNIVSFIKADNPESPIRSLYDLEWQGLDSSERYELPGLIYALAHLAETYTILRFGNHGTSKGTDITNVVLSKSIHAQTVLAAERANALLDKMAELRNDNG